MLRPEDFFALEGFAHGRLFEVEFAWEPLKKLEDYLRLALRGGEGEIPGPEIRGEVAPTAVVKGEVFLGEGSVVEPGAMIVGPTVIGRGCQIRQGAYIRAGNLIGEGAVVGHCTEVKASILLPGASAPHFNYVGDSIVGRGVNLGAGSILSNFKLTGEEIVVELEGKTYPTGLRKFGAVVGDGSQIGCNAVLNPGCLLGPRCLVYPCASVRGCYPADSVVKVRQQSEITPRLRA